MFSASQFLILYMLLYSFAWTKSTTFVRLQAIQGYLQGEAHMISKVALNRPKCLRRCALCPYKNFTIISIKNVNAENILWALKGFSVNEIYERICNMAIATTNANFGSRSFIICKNVKDA